MFTALIIGGLIGLILAIGVAVDQSQKKTATQAALAEDAIPVSHSYTSSDGSSGVGIYESTQTITFIVNEMGLIKKKSFPYSDLLSVELFQNGVSVTKTNRSSQIAGALLGSVLLGGVGVIVGGLSGSTTTKGKVNRIDLHVTVNDASHPVYKINFQNVSANESGFITNGNLSRAREWLGRIKIVMHVADQEETKEKQANIQNNEQLSNNENLAPKILSVADELRKLSDLYREGLLDATEFNQQKLRLLS